MIEFEYLNKYFHKKMRRWKKIAQKVFNIVRANKSLLRKEGVFQDTFSNFISWLIIGGQPTMILLIGRVIFSII